MATRSGPASGDGAWPAPVKPLPVLDAKGQEQVDLGLALDALGEDLRGERLGGADQALQVASADRVAHGSVDEGPVHLDDVGLEHDQGLERAPAEADVVDGDVHAGVLEALHGLMSELGMTGFVFAYTPVSMLPNGQPGTIRRILSGGFDREALDEWTRTTNPNSVGYRPLSHNFDPIRNYMAHQLLPQRIILKQFLSDQATARNVMATNWIQNLIHRGLRETFYTPVFTSAGELWSLGALRLETNPNTPGTSQPTQGDVRRMYEFLGTHFEEILSVSVSSALSGTYQGAVAAAARTDADDQISNIDSRNVSIALPRGHKQNFDFLNLSRNSFLEIG